MKNKYIHRTLEPVIKRAVREFPAAVLTGPRQAGKTTLLKTIFSDKFEYVSMEPPDIRASATADPRGFLEMHPPPVIFDEVQHAANLLPYIKEEIDKNRDRHGQFILTGSQNLLLAERVTESLAGRAAMLRLMPLSNREMSGLPMKPLPWEGKTKHADTPGKISSKELWSSFIRGGYPELAANPSRDYYLWHASYVQTYLERDLRSLRQVGDLGQFQIFLRVLASRSGQLLNMSGIARDLGITVNTVKEWLSILEATFQIIILRPYFANVGKRLVKMPKIYFTDVGTLCWLAGLKDPEHAAMGPMGGAIFETAVLSEIFKTLVGRGENPNLYFWRTSTGMEIDIIVDTGQTLIPVEVTINSTPNPARAKSIKVFQNDIGDRARRGYVIHPGDVRLPLGSGVTALPFSEV